MQWLSERFGLDVLRDCRVLLPTPEFFPEPYDGKPEDAERLALHIARHLGCDPSGYKIAFHDELELPDALGTYKSDDDGTAMIGLKTSLLKKPDELIATLAHELAHVRLLGEQRISPAIADHEFVTDLLPVYFGAGIFAANDTVRDWTTRSSGGEFWSIRKHGYMPSRLYGYAFALFAWVRGEDKPAWADHLRKDARDVFHSALRYLQKTGDSHFTPETAGRTAESLTVVDLIAELRTGSSSRQIGVLWTLSDRGKEAADAVSAVLKLTHSTTPMIAATALESLVEIGCSNAETESEIRPLLQHAHPTVRSMAICAALELSPRREEAAQDFVVSLNDPNRTVLCWAVHALGECGPSVATAEKKLLTVLKRAIVKRHQLLSVLCVHALRATDLDADSLRNAFPDPEIHGQAIDYLRDLRESDEPPRPPDPFTLSQRPG